MNPTAVTSNLRRSAAAAFVIAAIMAFGAAAVSTSGALAQPSPPEPAAEQMGSPDAQRQDAGVGPGNGGEAQPGGESNSKAESRAPAENAPTPAGDTASEEKAPASTASDPAAAEASTPDAAKPSETKDQTQSSGTTAASEAPQPAEPALEEPSRANATTPPAPIKEAAAPEPDMKKLTVSTWSGAYGEVQRDVVIERFEAKQSISVDVLERNGEDPIDLTTASGGGLPDAAEFSGREIDAGCRAGQLVKLEDGTANGIVAPAVANDFLPGSLKPCGIGAFAWSHVLAVNRQAFEKRQPETLTDVFDTKRFPGKRAFIKDPRFLMEVALMADGTKPAEVYEILGSAEGQQRAFAKLASIREDIVWVSDSKAAMEAVTKGEVAIAQSFSGRAFFAAARGVPINVIWDGQIYSMTYWAIPAKSPRKKMARAFLDFATEPQQLAAVAQRFPYGPTRTSALSLTKRHLSSGLDLEAHLPTTPANLKTALSINEEWWDENSTALEAAFAEWMTNREAAPEAPVKSD